MYANICGALVAAYALSPIDLIPDFIPVVGYLDDLLLLPLGIWIVIKLIPADVMDECREKATQISDPLFSAPAAVVIVVIWVTMSLIAGWFIYTSLTSQ